MISQCILVYLIGGVIALCMGLFYVLLRDLWAPSSFLKSFLFWPMLVAWIVQDIITYPPDVSQVSIAISTWWTLSPVPRRRRQNDRP